MFLKGKGANQRVYTKNIDWNPQTHPDFKVAVAAARRPGENRFYRSALCEFGYGFAVYSGVDEVHLEWHETHGFRH